MAIQRTGTRVSQPLSKSDRTRHAQIREQHKVEKSEIMAKGLAIKAEFDARQECFRDAVAAIKQAREQQGLSLTETALRSGIDKGNLSKLENGITTSCTIETLQRYAAAVGKEIVFTLVDRAA